MRKALIALAMLGTAAAVAPAAAQYDRGDRYGYGQGYDRGRLQQIGFRIDRGVQRGDISRREAYALRRDLGYLYQLDRRYRYNGLTRWERTDLDRRADALAQRIRWERNDRDGRRYDDRRY